MDEVIYVTCVSKGRQNKTTTFSYRWLISSPNVLLLKSKILPSFSLSYSILLEPELHCLGKEKIKHFNKSSAMKKHQCVQEQFLASFLGSISMCCKFSHVGRIK